MPLRPAESLPDCTHKAYAAPERGPVLGPRLLAVAALVARARNVADIGCDHGKLAVWLALAGAPRVVAVDSRPLPLARARALVCCYGCEDVVRCVLGSGLMPLAAEDIAEVVIAGLSAGTAAGILSEALSSGLARLPSAHFVISPSTRHPQLRLWLCQNGFRIEKERVSIENGRAYTAVSARYTGLAFEPQPLFCQLGLVRGGEDTAAARAYIRARLAHLRKQSAAPMDLQGRRRHARLIEEVERCLL